MASKKQDHIEKYISLGWISVNSCLSNIPLLISDTIFPHLYWDGKISIFSVSVKMFTRHSGIT